MSEKGELDQFIDNRKEGEETTRPDKKQESLDLFGEGALREAFVFMHPSEGLENALKDNISEEAYEEYIDRINQLRKSKEHPVFNVNIHHWTRKLPGNKKRRIEIGTTEEVDSLEKEKPEGLEYGKKDLHYVNMIDERKIKASKPYKKAMRAPYEDMEKMAKEEIIPTLKKQNVKKITLFGTTLGSCVKRFAEIASENGIDVEIPAKSSVEVEVDSDKAKGIVEKIKEKIMRKKEKGEDFHLTPAEVEEIGRKEGDLNIRDYSIGPEEPIYFESKDQEPEEEME